MRIYLEVGQTISKENGGQTIYAPGFYEVDDDLGLRWLAEEVAKKATKANEVTAPPAKPGPAPKKKPIALPPPDMGKGRGSIIEEANDGDKPSEK